MQELVRIAQHILDDRDAPELEKLTSGVAGGVTGELKNLIFAALGPKPEIVLRDATTNDIEVTEGLERCLVYDRPLGADGLSWGELVDWYADEYTQDRSDLRTVSHTLWDRLNRSLGSNEPERLIHRTYSSRYDTAATPALIPQVYLHFDPHLHDGRPRQQRSGGSVWISCFCSLDGDGSCSRSTENSTTPTVTAEPTPPPTPEWSPRTAGCN